MRHFHMKDKHIYKKQPPLIFQNSILAVAGDDETVRLCDVEKAKWVCDFKAHETR